MRWRATKDFSVFVLRMKRPGLILSRIGIRMNRRIFESAILSLECGFDFESTLPCA